jgi:hypothetical protein
MWPGLVSDDLLRQSSECWDYRHVPSHPASIIIFGDHHYIFSPVLARTALYSNDYTYYWSVFLGGSSPPHTHSPKGVSQGARDCSNIPSCPQRDTWPQELLSDALQPPDNPPHSSHF